MNAETQTMVEAEDLGSRGWRPPERFKNGKCAECNAPLSTYNPNTICEPCREKLKREILPHDRPIQIEHFWVGYLLKFHRREPIVH